MCGLIGWFGSPARKVDDQALARAMVTAIAHRGPDRFQLLFWPRLSRDPPRLIHLVQLHRNHNPGRQMCNEAICLVAVRVRNALHPAHEILDVRTDVAIT